jgi:hypothetical protein
MFGVAVNVNVTENDRKDEVARLLRHAAHRYHQGRRTESEDLLYAAAVLFAETVLK